MQCAIRSWRRDDDLFSLQVSPSSYELNTTACPVLVDASSTGCLSQPSDVLTDRRPYSGGHRRCICCQVVAMCDPSTGAGAKSSIPQSHAAMPRVQFPIFFHNIFGVSRVYRFALCCVTKMCPVIPRRVLSFGHAPLIIDPWGLTFYAFGSSPVGSTFPPAPLEKWYRSVNYGLLLPDSLPCPPIRAVLQVQDYPTGEGEG